MRLSHDNLERILNVMRKSLNLEELYLDNLGLKADFINKLANVIKSNPATALHTLDLSNNMIEDKGKKIVVFVFVCFFFTFFV